MITETRKNIFIISHLPYHQPGFEKQVKADLQKIEENPIGKRLIEKIAANAHRVFIESIDEGSACASCVYTESSESKSCITSEDPKKGTDSLISFAPAERVIGCTDQLQPLEIPSFIGLFHELVHVHHNSRGKLAQTNNYDKRVWTIDEEYHTIMGFPSKKPHRQTPKITENAFRIAQDLPCRYGHLSFATLQNDRVLANHFKLEKTKTLAKFFHDSVPPLNRNLKTEDLLPLNKQKASFWIRISRKFKSRKSK